jgi:hypothetical protein
MLALGFTVVECRMQWGAKFAEAMVKKAMAKKAHLP